MNKRKTLKTAAFLFILLVSASFCFAGTATPGIYGKVAGRVVDKENGEPLPGANVIIEGTTLGAASDADGYFTILQVLPGKYSVVVQMIGFRKTRQTDVRVRVDLTSTVNFSLEAEVISGQEVTVIAERPLVIADETGSSVRVNSEEIEDIPGVTTVTDAVQLMPGVVGEGEDLHVRGGRSGEAVYMVDGVAVNDALFNGQIPQVNKYSVQEIELLTGGYNAEYGNAQSGIVNIVTRSGGPKYSGRIAHYTDHLIGSGRFPSDILNVDNPLEVSMLDVFNNSGEGIRSNSFNTDRTEFNFGGPEPITNNLLPSLGMNSLKGKVHFFLAGTAEMSDGYLPNEDQGAKELQHKNEDFDFVAGEVEEPGEAPEVRFVGQPQLLEHPFRQSFLGLFDWGGRFTNNVNYSARLSYRVNDNINTSLSFTGSQFWRDSYTHYWLFKSERSNQTEGRSSNYVFSWNHTLSTKSFYTVRLGHLDNFRLTYPGMRNGIRLLPDAMNNRVTADEDILINYSGDQNFYTDDELAPIDTYDERVLNRPDPRTGYVKSDFEDDWFKHTTQIWTLKLDYLNQINRNNELKFGFEWKYNDLHQEQISAGENKVVSRRVNPPDNGPYITSGSIRDFYDRFPNTGSAYVQDKIEFESLIINAGLRFDRFDPGAQVFETGEAFLTEDTEKQRVNTKNYFSPRLGLSHPITDRSRLYFFYGRFIQMPTLNELYRRQNRFRIFQNQLNIFGNPDLEAEETISYEVGFDQQLTDNWKIGVTGFFKDIRNQINTEIFGPDAATFRKVVNRDFGQDRGFEFDLVKRFGNYYSANINYTLMWATTRASTVNRGTGTTQIRYGNLQEVPSNWDQRHTINANVRFEIPAGRGFRLFGTTVDQMSLTFFWRYGSGQPFTVDVDSDPNRLINAERLPYFSELDMRFRKDFKLFSNVFAQFYLDIQNLLNRRNVLDLLGDADHSCVECEITDPVTNVVRTVTFEHGNPEGNGDPRDLDPEQFGPPRQIMLGFGLRF